MYRVLLCVGILWCVGCSGNENKNQTEDTSIKGDSGDPNDSDSDTVVDSDTQGNTDTVNSATDTNDDPLGDSDSPIRGLFLTEDSLTRAQQRMDNDDAFDSIANQFASRVSSARNMVSNPFRMDDVTSIRFGWCENPDYTTFDTLNEAAEQFSDQSDGIRSLALSFVLDGIEIDGEKAVEVLMDYANRQTVVNLHDLDVDYENATVMGVTGDAYCGDMPWNFALDAMWQTYGLINVADAYLLLTRNGYTLTDTQDATIRAWIQRLVEAVNASFHAWTRWADLHPSSGAYERYRSDNHLSWSLAGLMAGAAALDDSALMNYVIVGGAWEDSRSGVYENPSNILDVIDRAIDGDGLVYEEKIQRDPPIGYSFFHLWAILLVGEMASIHSNDNSVWEYVGTDGGSLQNALTRYGEYLLGTRSIDSGESQSDLVTSYGWLYELAAAPYGNVSFLSVVNTTTRDRWVMQSGGPMSLLLGPDIP